MSCSSRLNLSAFFLLFILFTSVCATPIDITTRGIVSADGGTAVVMTIDKSGVFPLTDDFTGEIIVSANNVVLDLGGYTVRGGTNGIRVTGNNVIVKNGTVSGASEVGIKIEGNKNKLIGLDLVSNTTGVEVVSSDANVIEQCRALCNTSAGFSLVFSKNNCIINCKAVDNGTSLDVFGFVAAGGLCNTFEQCVAQNTQTSGALAIGFALTGTETKSKIIDSQACDTSGADAFGIRVLSNECNVIKKNHISNTTANVITGTGIGLQDDALNSSTNQILANFVCKNDLNLNIGSQFPVSSSSVKGVGLVENIDCDSIEPGVDEQIKFTIIDQVQTLCSKIDLVDIEGDDIKFTVVDSVENAQASLGFTVCEKIDNTQQSLAFTIVDTVENNIADAVASIGFTVCEKIENAQLSLAFTIADAVSTAVIESLAFTICDKIENEQASLGFTIVDTVENNVNDAVASLGFTIADAAQSICSKIDLVDMEGDDIKFTVVDSIDNAQASLGFTVCEKIDNTQQSLAFTIVDTVENNINDAVASIGFTVCDKVDNAQASIGFTICDLIDKHDVNICSKIDNVRMAIGAIDGSLVEHIISHMEHAVQTFTTLSSIVDHVLMTLTAIDDLAMDIMDNFTSINEMIEKVKFTVCDKAEQTVASLGFTICDKIENAQLSLAFTIVDALDADIGDAVASLGFTICDKVVNAQVSLAFTIVDTVENNVADAVASLGFTIVDAAESICSKIDVIDMEGEDIKFTVVDSIDNATQSLGFTICDKANSILDKLDNLEFMISGTILIDNGPVLIAIDDAVASLGFTIVDTVEDNVNDAVASLGFTIVDQAQSICSKLDAIDMEGDDIKFTIVDSVDNAAQSLGFTVLDAVDNAVQSLGFTICDKIQQATLCNPTVVTASTTIDTSGHYCLANNATGDFLITASNVRFDLNGYTISGGTNGIRINANEVQVHNGTVRGASGAGIRVEGDKNKLHDLELVDNATGLLLSEADSNVIEDVQALCSTSIGFDIISNSDFNCITNCKAVNTSSTMASVVGFNIGSGTFNTLKNCVAKDTIGPGGPGGSADGFLLAGPVSAGNNTIIHCTAVGTTGGGTGFSDIGLSSSTNSIYSNFSCDNDVNYSIGTQFPISAAGSKGVGETENIDCALVGTDDFEEIKFTIVDSVDNATQSLRFTICEKIELVIETVLTEAAAIKFTVVDQVETVQTKIDSAQASLGFTICDKAETICSKIDSLEACEATPVFAATTIAVPGHYCLANDIDVGSGSEMLITSSDVTFNLNGHTINVTGGFAGVLVASGAMVPSNVTIRNGTVRCDGSTSSIGLSFLTTTKCAVNDCKLIGCETGIFLSESDSALITNCRALCCVQDGFLISNNSDFNCVANCKAIGTNNSSGLARGFRIASGTFNAIEGCVAKDTSGTTSAEGFLLAGSVDNNSITNCVSIDTQSSAGIGTGIRDDNGDSSTNSIYSNFSCDNETNYSIGTQFPISGAQAKGVGETENIDCSVLDGPVDELGFTICNKVDNAVQSLGFTVCDKVDNTQQSLAFTIVDTVENNVSDAVASIGFTVCDKVDNAQQSLAFTIVDTVENNVNDAVASIGFTVCDKVDNAQQSLGYTICDLIDKHDVNICSKIDDVRMAIGAIDGSLVEHIISHMEHAVQTFTTISSIVDHVLMTLTAIDDLAMDIMDNFSSINEMLEKVKFTVCDKAEQTVASLGFTICDKVDNVQQSLAFTIADRVDNAVQSLGFTVSDRVDNAVQSIGFTVCDKANSILEKLDNLEFMISGTVLVDNGPVLEAIDGVVGSLGFTICEKAEMICSKIDLLEPCDPTPISQADMDAAGGLLALTADLASASRNYCLTQNITGTICIADADISLDLNDRKLSGLLKIDHDCAIVKNGTVVAPAPADAADAAFAAIRITTAADSTFINNCRVVCTDSTGAIDGRSAISVSGTESIITDCVVTAGGADSGNGGHGIEINTPAADTLVEDCLVKKAGTSVSGAGGDGIRINSGTTNTVVRNNTISRSGSGATDDGMAIRDLSTAAPSGTSKMYSNFAFDIANTFTVYKIENEGAFTTDNGVDLISGLPGPFSNVYAPSV